MSEDERLGTDALRDVLKDVAAEVPGAEVVLPPEPDPATRRILELVAPQQVEHTLRDDLVIVPIDGGARDVVLGALAIDGADFVQVNCWMLLRIPEEGEPLYELESVLADINVELGPTATWLAPDAVGLTMLVPASGLTTTGLFDAITLVGRAAERHQARLDELELGARAPGLWASWGWPAPTAAWSTMRG